MQIGRFYFIKDEYFEDFPDTHLMGNKKTANGQPHDRPCFFAFADENNLFWVIPISSRVNKYRDLYARKIERYGKCDTIVFGDVLGSERAFLIQNMCPITTDYIASEYCDRRDSSPVSVDGVLERDLITKANKVLRLQRKGSKLIFPDVLAIEAKLLDKITENNEN